MNLKQHQHEQFEKQEIFFDNDTNKDIKTSSDKIYQVKFAYSPLLKTFEKKKQERKLLL